MRTSSGALAGVIGVTAIGMVSMAIWALALRDQADRRTTCVSPIKGTTCAIGYATLAGYSVGSAITCGAARSDLDLAAAGAASAISDWQVSRQDGDAAHRAYGIAMGNAIATNVKMGVAPGSSSCSAAFVGLTKVQAWRVR